ncbi:arsinothricin resistance N-acetyltransferase ArsN1 family B [Solilutibacter silvestris]|uniref:Sortase and related acyltransferase n=1 Tax=Solilutibacter silvestris TaxID=1645665 RepID=A0A2K1Q0W3_9GAMM|nr:arsinothricin resistance N-acetyltransferase ArsN1 family B [Lysobacter silvestris]PNS08681.1 Sortase and related acyltransferase [Lysobacter silvestris]
MGAEAAIRDAVDGDATIIAAIYNAHVRDTIVTFELEDVAAEEMARRIAQVQSLGLPWLVAQEDGVVIGYAYAGRWKARAAYARTVESSIYLADAACGRGLGKRLYAVLIERLRALGIHAVIGGVSLPNAVSVALHEGLGFTPVGAFREVGWKFGRWIDVGYWQLRLDDAAVA